jgi:hypothetical protein
MNGVHRAEKALLDRGPARMSRRTVLLKLLKLEFPRTVFKTSIIFSICLMVWILGLRQTSISERYLHRNSSIPRPQYPSAYAPY